MSAPTATQHETPKNAPLVQAAEANEWGQITGLEPKTTYFVIRRPSVELTRERSRELVGDVKTFLQEQRAVTEKQVQELQEKYGQPAKAKAQELRATLEQRFDAVAKEVEQRFGDLETKLGDRAPGFIKRKEGSTEHGETPGEMPTGENGGSPSATSTKKKASAKKSE